MPGSPHGSLDELLEPDEPPKPLSAELPMPMHSSYVLWSKLPPESVARHRQYASPEVSPVMHRQTLSGSV